MLAKLPVEVVWRILAHCTHKPDWSDAAQRICRLGREDSEGADAASNSDLARLIHAGLGCLSHVAQSCRLLQDTVYGNPSLWLIHFNAVYDPMSDFILDELNQLSPTDRVFAIIKVAKARSRALACGCSTSRNPSQLEVLSQMVQQHVKKNLSLLLISEVPVALMGLAKASGEFFYSHPGSLQIVQILQHLSHVDTRVQDLIIDRFFPNNSVYNIDEGDLPLSDNPFQNDPVLLTRLLIQTRRIQLIVRCFLPPSAIQTSSLPTPALCVPTSNILKPRQSPHPNPMTFRQFLNIHRIQHFPLLHDEFYGSEASSRTVRRQVETNFPDTHHLENISSHSPWWAAESTGDVSKTALKDSAITLVNPSTAAWKLARNPITSPSATLSAYELATLLSGAWVGYYLYSQYLVHASHVDDINLLKLQCEVTQDAEGRTFVSFSGRGQDMFGEFLILRGQAFPQTRVVEWIKQYQTHSWDYHGLITEMGIGGRYGHGRNGSMFWYWRLT